MDTLQPGAKTDRFYWEFTCKWCPNAWHALDSASLTGFVSMEGSREYAIPAMAQ